MLILLQVREEELRREVEMRRKGAGRDTVFGKGNEF